MIEVYLTWTCQFSPRTGLLAHPYKPLSHRARLGLDRPTHAHTHRPSPVCRADVAHAVTTSACVLTYVEA